LPEQRVAVYLDFDNIVISRFDQVHGKGSFQRDRARVAAGERPESELQSKLEQAVVDVGAIIDFASSFGTLVLTRAYADWSTPVNARYRSQLVGRAVDLVQLFPAAAYAKNGADIRLAVDAVEDMFRLPDLTHVVIVGGDSDYIALAQRCKRLGRYVVGIGVAGSSSRSLAAACDEFVSYDALPGVPAPPPRSRPVRVTEPDPEPEAEAERAEDRDAEQQEPGQAEPPKRRRSRRAAAQPEEEQEQEQEAQEDPQATAAGLLERALRLGHEKDDADWLHTSAVKQQMKRMDPSFSEKALGFRSFSDFLRSRTELVDLDEDGNIRLVRLQPALAGEPEAAAP
jgi:uncharacterized LabA/DUF88 family protein